MKSRILITGGCGKIGSYFATYAMDAYVIRVVDRVAWDIEKNGPLIGESMIIDLQNYAACRQACEDIEVVIHLAADGDPEADFEASLLGNNVIATHNMFRAAKAAGCQRFIFASSAHVISAYAADVQIRENMLVKPGNKYGVTKCFGEALAAYYAYVENLSSIVIRIGAYTFPTEYANFSQQEMNAFLDPDDFNALLIQCIETPDIDFAIAHAISDNQYKLLDLSETRKTFGYQPKADAFEVFKLP